MSWSYPENQSISVDPTTLGFKPVGSFYKDMVTFCAAAKIKIHPSFREPKPEDDPLLQAALVRESLERLEEEKNAAEEAKLAVKEIEVLPVYTKKVDKNSIYAIQAVLPASKIHTVKFSNNGFTYENCELLFQVLPSTNCTRFFFDWNPVPTPKKKKEEGEAEVKESLFTKLIDNPKLEFLYLRSDGINDDCMVPICEKLALNNKLRCLDLSLNIFKGKGIKLLIESLKNNYTLEYLGLASMELTMADIKPLLDEFGKFKLTPEEAADLQQKTKERDLIVEKNKKAKGKKEEPVPRVPAMVTDDQGNSFILKKEHFKHLNIGLNSLDDSAIEELDKLLGRTPTHFNLTIVSRHITKDASKTLTGKYGDRVIA